MVKSQKFLVTNSGKGCDQVSSWCVVTVRMGSSGWPRDSGCLLAWGPAVLRVGQPARFHPESPSPTLGFADWNGPCGFRDALQSLAHGFLDLLGAAAAHCAEMWFCHASRLLPGLFCAWMNLHVGNLAEEKSPLASCHPLRDAGSKLVSSQSDFKEIRFVLKFLFEE